VGKERFICASNFLTLEMRSLEMITHADVYAYTQGLFYFAFNICCFFELCLHVLLRLVYLIKLFAEWFYFQAFVNFKTFSVKCS